MPNTASTNHFVYPARSSRRQLLRWGLIGSGLIGVGLFGGACDDEFSLRTPHTSTTHTPASHTLYTYSGYASPIGSVAWSPDGKRIVCAGSAAMIQVLDADTGHLLFTYRGHPGALNVCWSPDSTHIASAGGSFLNGVTTCTVQVWNASTGQQHWAHQDVTESPSSGLVAWSADGKQIATSGPNQTIQIRGALDGKLLQSYTGSLDTSSCAWSPDSRFIASGGNGQSIQVWRARDGQTSWSYGNENGAENGPGPSYVDAIGWSPDGTRIVSAGSCPIIAFATNGGVQIWDANTGHKQIDYEGHDARSDIRAVGWSPKGENIASAGTDNTVQVWSASTGKTVFSYGEHTDEVSTFDWSPDGTRIVSGGNDRTLRVWRVQSA